MLHKTCSLLAAVSICFVAGCSNDGTGLDNDNRAQIIEQRSSKVYEINPSVTDAQIQTLSAGINSFGLSMLGELQGGDGNIMISPYSIAAALTMVYGGTEGELATQMEAVLGMSSLTPDAVHTVHNRLSLDLQARGAGASGREGEGFTLNVNNALWGDQTQQFKPGYLDLLSSNYNCGINTVDFINQPEESRVLINKWVEDRTNGKIKDLIAQLSSDTRMVLTNTVYFDAAWATEFDPALTTKEKFKKESDSVEVDFMKMDGYLPYYESPKLQAVDIPYDGGEIVMTVVLPKGEMGDFLSSFGPADMAAMDPSLELRTGVRISIPKFSFTFGTKSLVYDLVNIGMEKLFILPLTGVGEGLVVTDVLHKTFVAVDEVGTTAAAATGVIVEVTSMPPVEPVVELNANKPFLFMIRDVPSGVILFLGKVQDPA